MSLSLPGGADSPIIPDIGSTSIGGGFLSGMPSAGLLTAGASVLGAALSPKAAGPSSANSIFSTNLAFDNSGWNVSMPGSTISSAVDKTMSQGGASGLSGNMSNYLPYALIFAGALIAWRMTKK